MSRVEASLIHANPNKSASSFSLWPNCGHDWPHIHFCPLDQFGNCLLHFVYINHKYSLFNKCKTYKRLSWIFFYQLNDHVDLPNCLQSRTWNGIYNVSTYSQSHCDTCCFGIHSQLQSLATYYTIHRRPIKNIDHTRHTYLTLSMLVCWCLVQGFGCVI